MLQQDLLRGKFAHGILSLLGLKPGTIPGAKGAKKVLYEGYIANYQYHKGQQLEHLFEPGTPFELKHEPENPFDEDAVAVFYQNNKIGFVPQSSNVPIAQKLKQGRPVRAKVARMLPHEEPWARVHVQVLEE
jgi:hypothetical protein